MSELNRHTLKSLAKPLGINTDLFTEEAEWDLLKGWIESRRGSSDGPLSVSEIDALNEKASAIR